MILDKILEVKKQEVETAKIKIPLDMLIDLADLCCMPMDFSEYLMRNKKGIPAVITEVKKASPSKGIIRKDFDPVKIAKSYESGGASAISVLTDEQFFMGSLDYLTSIKNYIDIPLLRKDFIIDAYQIYESRAAGADAILIIMAALEDDLVIEFLNTAKNLGMKCLVETHDESEVERAIKCGAEIIGINNRNLQTFEVSLETSKRLIPLIPKDKKIVSESGIWTREDMQMLGNIGCDGVLIGESLMREENIEAKLKELIG